MSIITEALNKAQKGIPVAAEQSSLKKDSVIGSTLKLESAKRKSGLNWGPVFVMLILAVITMPIVAPLFSSPFKNTQRPAKSEAQKVSVSNLQQTTGTNVPADMPMAATMQQAGARKAQFGIEEIPLNMPALPMQPVSQNMEMPDFSLNGIMISGDESYCIINNRVKRVGDTIAGAKVISIKPGQVSLEYNGQTIDINS